MATPEVTMQEPPVETFEESRRRYIGGSDIYQLLEEKEYGKGCHTQLAYEKLNIPPDRLIPTKDGIFKRGHWFEDPIAEEYELVTGRKVRRQPMRVNRDFPWAGVRMDRQIISGTGIGENLTTTTGALEIKSLHPYTFKKMVREKAPRGATLLQIQHSMFVTGYSWAAFAGMNVLDCDLRHYDTARDEGIIDLIKREGDIFWKAIEAKQVPAPTITDPEDARCKICSWRKTCRGKELDEAALEAHERGNLVQISDPALAQDLEDREKVRMEMSDLKGLLEGIEESIKLKLADHKLVEVDGAFRVHYKPGTTSRFQAKQFEALCVSNTFLYQYAANLLAGIDTLEGELREGMIQTMAKYVVDAQYKKFYETGIPTARSLRVYSI